MTHASGGFTSKLDDYLPNFIVTRSGVERHFTKTAQTNLRMLATRLFSDRPTYGQLMREAEFTQLLRSCIADLHAEGLLAPTPSTGRAQLKMVKQEVDQRLPSYKLAFGHEFAATTLRLEETAPYQIGPVDVRSVLAWLETVSLSDRVCERYGIDPSSNWKSQVAAALEAARHASRHDFPPHLQGLVDALQGCDAVVSVAVYGLEQTYSREVARMVARTALDGVSLLSGLGRNAFSQQALCDERLQPLRLSSMIVFKGEHWVGSSWSSRAIGGRPPAGVADRVFKTERLHSSLCDVVSSLLDSRSHRHPNLATRWATALEWFAEGCRETATSVAVTKVAAALDILTCGKTASGITAMLSNVLGRAANDTVFEGVTDNLSQIVEAIYGGGRSQLLHGNKVDRRVAFDAELGQAQALGHRVLVTLLDRLTFYDGPDTEHAFITMPGRAEV